MLRVFLSSKLEWLLLRRLLLVITPVPLAIVATLTGEQLQQTQKVVVMVLVTAFGVVACGVVIASYIQDKAMYRHRKKNLQAFLTEWQEEYQKKASSIPLFQIDVTKKWTLGQKQYFVRLFYHARGHFVNFLWLLANCFEWSPNAYAYRKVILSNIADELGMKGMYDRTHEQLYDDFARSIHVPLQAGPRDDTDYLPFLRAFNQGHLEWIRAHQEAENWAFFAAYELLDNADYVNLHALAESIGATEQSLVFFDVHVGSNHFNDTQELLLDVWVSDQASVRKAFDFIASHQLSMWQGISDAIEIK